MSLLFSIFSFIAVGQNDPDLLTGKWKTEEGKIVTISEENGIFTGKVVGEKNKIVNILKNMKYSKDKYNGVLYAAKRNMTLDCTIKVKEEDTIEVTVKKGFIEKTLKWNRI